MTNEDNELVYSETTEKFSIWKNTNNVAANFRLLTHQKIKPKGRNPNHQNHGDCQASLFLRITVKPGETIKLPAEYDQAIRKVSPRSGEVVGGLCPWLVKVGEEDLVINKSLDYKVAINEEQAMNALQALKKENHLREALEEIEKAKANLKKK